MTPAQRRHYNPAPEKVLTIKEIAEDYRFFRIDTSDASQHFFGTIVHRSNREPLLFTSDGSRMLTIAFCPRTLPRPQGNLPSDVFPRYLDQQEIDLVKLHSGDRQFLDGWCFCFCVDGKKIIDHCKKMKANIFANNCDRLRREQLQELEWDRDFQTENFSFKQIFLFQAKLFEDKHDRERLRCNVATHDIIVYPTNSQDGTLYRVDDPDFVKLYAKERFSYDIDRKSLNCNDVVSRVSKFKEDPIICSIGLDFLTNNFQARDADQAKTVSRELYRQVVTIAKAVLEEIHSTDKKVIDSGYMLLLELKKWSHAHGSFFPDTLFKKLADARPVDHPSAPTTAVAVVTPPDAPETKCEKDSLQNKSEEPVSKDMQRELEKSRLEIKDLETKNKNLQQEVEILRRDKAELSATQSRIRTSEDNAKTESQSRAQEIRMLQFNLAKVEKDTKEARCTLQQELQQTKKDTKKLQAELAEARQCTKEWHASYQELHHKMGTAAADYDKKLNSRKKILGAKDEELASSTKSLLEREAHLKKANAEVERLHAQYNKMIAQHSLGSGHSVSSAHSGDFPSGQTFIREYEGFVDRNYLENTLANLERLYADKSSPKLCAALDLHDIERAAFESARDCLLEILSTFGYTITPLQLSQVNYLRDNCNGKLLESIQDAYQTIINKHLDSGKSEDSEDSEEKTDGSDVDAKPDLFQCKKWDAAIQKCLDEEEDDEDDEDEQVYKLEYFFKSMARFHLIALLSIPPFSLEVVGRGPSDGTGDANRMYPVRTDETSGKKYGESADPRKEQQDSFWLETKSPTFMDPWIKFDAALHRSVDSTVTSRMALKVSSWFQVTPALRLPNMDQTAIEFTCYVKAKAWPDREE